MKFNDLEALIEAFNSGNDALVTSKIEKIKK